MRFEWSVFFAIALVVGCASTGEQPTDEPAEVELDWSRDIDRSARDLSPVSVEPETVLIENATVMTAAGDIIDGGSVLLEDGRIVAISAGELDAPDGAAVVDGTDKFVTPGIIDTHSHLGVYPTPHVAAHMDGNEMTAPTTPDVSAAHGVWPQDPGFQKALAGGITSLQILPGSANLIGGRAVTLQMHPGISTEAMRFPQAPPGLKMACGENPKRVYGSRGQKPSTRMGSMAVFRQTFQKAREALDTYRDYRERKAGWEASEKQDPMTEPKEPARDFGMETLMGVLTGDVLVHVHCYRADEMIQILQLADEYGFDVRSFHHAVEAYKIRDVLAEWNVSVSTWADWWGFKIEAHDAIPQNAALVSEAGAPAVIHSDSAYGIQRLNQEAAKAMWRARHAGMEVTDDEALRWITYNAAWALGIEEMTGTLEQGKRADVVLWSHHPFSVYARAEKVWVEGVREYDREQNPQPWSDFEVSQLPKSDEEGQ
ncbi:MAG: amidohydrolase family protein [Myxococcota bacterium]